MITRPTVPGSPPPTIPAPGNVTAVPPLGLASIPPRTRYYAAPDVDPAAFSRQIPQGQHLGIDYSEHFKREFPVVMSQALQLPYLANSVPDQQATHGASYVFPGQNPAQSPGGTHALVNSRMGPYQSAGGQAFMPIEVPDQRVDPMEGLISKLTQVTSEQFRLKP